MKKSPFVFSLIMVGLCGFCLTASGSPVALIDQLGVAKIVSMEVRPLFVLTDQSFAWLKAANVPEDVLSNPALLALQDQPYYGRDVFSNVLEQAVGRDALQQTIKKRRVETLILRYARQRPSAAAPPLLDILVEMSNQNDRDLKIASASFEFFIHDPEAPGELISIGVDHSYQDQEIDLPAKPAEQPAIPTLVRFSVGMGADCAAAFDPLTHLVNFAGIPSDDDYLFVRGKFDLGIKSSKGWSYGQSVQVEWMFCPDVQNQLPLEECFHELPEPIVLPTPMPTPTPPETGYDEYGNPKSRAHELGWGDNERLQKEKILLYAVYNGQDDPEGFAWRHAKDSVATRQIRMDILKPSSRGNCSLLTPELLSQYTQLWFVSDKKRCLTTAQIEMIADFVQQGSGLLIWADNEPYYADANALAEKLIGTQFSGDKKGNKVLSSSTTLKPGSFIDHPLTQGVNKLYEGITISTIRSAPFLTLLAQSHDGQMCMACFEKDKQRIVLDTGFTKLIGDNFYNTAGTARYFRNIAFWLSAASREFDYQLLTTGREGLATIKAGEESEHYRFDLAEPAKVTFDLYLMGKGSVRFSVKNPAGELVHNAVYNQPETQVALQAEAIGEWECWLNGVSTPENELQYVLSLKMKKEQ
jgi:hypothetical protein